MKKQLYLLTLLTIGSSVSFAQLASENQVPLKKSGKFLNPKNKQFQAKDFDNPLWESDFSDPGVWTIGNDAGNDDDWVIGTDVPSGDFPIAGINSPTAENGFALFDSDLLCSGNQNAWIQTEEIDISSAQSVSIQFQTYYGAFQGSCFIETSTDGNVWQPMEILADIDPNDVTANPLLMTFNLTELDGEDAAFIRFVYVGGCDYAWMIDDVKIAATPEFDLRLNQAWYDEHILLLNDPDAPYLEYVENLEYSSYRVGDTRPLTFVAEVENLGFGTLTDVTVTFTVNTPDGPEDFTTDPITLEPLAIDTVVFSDAALSAFASGGVIGEYTVSFLADAGEEESDDSNNVIADKSFSVNEERMANDNGDFYQAIGQTADDVIWGNQFSYVQENTINYIQFGLADEIIIDGQGTLTTIPGNEIWLNIREGSVFETDVDDSERLFDEDDIEYVIEEEAISTGGALNWITIMLEDPITLEGNTVYQAEVQFPGIGEPYALIAQTTLQEALAGGSFDFNNQSTVTASGFFSLGSNAPAIRMGFAGPTSTTDRNDLGFYMSQNYPNPAVGGASRISWELMFPASNVQFAITDNSGKLVFQKDLGDRPAGVQEDIILNNLNLAAGVYQYSLKVGNDRLVRKMIVAK